MADWQNSDLQCVKIFVITVQKEGFITGVFRDLTGQTFGHLVVLKRAETRIGKGGHRRTMWLCRCSCGAEKEISSDALTSGNQISCGCVGAQHRKEATTKHGMADTPLYRVWNTIKSRCYNKNVRTYKYYGGRGIKMCDEWYNDFGAFRDWAFANGYQDGVRGAEQTIDRIDVDGDYTPDNCRIITQTEQMNNIRTNHRIEYNGESHTIAEWSRITGINQFKIRARMTELGWTAERALTTP